MRRIFHRFWRFRPVRGLAALFVVPLWLAAAAPAPETAQTASLGGVMGALGEGSQLLAAEDGEFAIDLDENKNLETFRAIRDVIVLTEDMALRCHEMIYDRQQGVITATAAPGNLVHIQMSNIGGEGGLIGGGNTRATCRLYKFFVNKREHLLMHDPVIYERDEAGKETAVSGDLVTIHQDDRGRWQMHIKGERGRSAPNSEAELQWARKLKRAREMWGILKPIINIDMRAPGVAAVPTTSTKGLKLDAANLDLVRREKSSSLAEIERGGPTQMGTIMPSAPGPEPR